jgi:hypothetical protein
MVIIVVGWDLYIGLKWRSIAPPLPTTLRTDNRRKPYPYDRLDFTTLYGNVRDKKRTAVCNRPTQIYFYKSFFVLKYF